MNQASKNDREHHPRTKTVSNFTKQSVTKYLKISAVEMDQNKGDIWGRFDTYLRDFNKVPLSNFASYTKRLLVIAGMHRGYNCLKYS